MLWAQNHKAFLKFKAKIGKCNIKNIPLEHFNQNLLLSYVDDTYFHKEDYFERAVFGFQR